MVIVASRPRSEALSQLLKSDLSPQALSRADRNFGKVPNTMYQISKPYFDINEVGPSVMMQSKHPPSLLLFNCACDILNIKVSINNCMHPPANLLHERPIMNERTS